MEWLPIETAPQGGIVVAVRCEDRKLIVPAVWVQGSWAEVRRSNSGGSWELIANSSGGPTPVFPTHWVTIPGYQAVSELLPDDFAMDADAE